MRCFLAITPPEPVCDRLAALARQIPVGRIVPPENLHLTLAFLGDLNDAQAVQLHEALCGIEADGFAVAFTGLDLFGGAQPKILHATVRPSDPLAALHRKLLQVARSEGVALKRERFRPHVTLARFHRALARPDLDRLAAFLRGGPMPPLPGFDVTGFSLFRSDLGGGPARYTELAEYPLPSSQT